MSRYLMALGTSISDKELGHAIQAVLAPETTALGNIKGQLEYINLHGQTNVFRVYPFIGPSYVECRFPSLPTYVRHGAAKELE